MSVRSLRKRQINWLNVFYGIEWVVFAGFAFFLWYRMVRDDYQRDLDEIAERAAEARRSSTGRRRRLETATNSISRKPYFLPKSEGTTNDVQHHPGTEAPEIRRHP